MMELQYYCSILNPFYARTLLLYMSKRNSRGITKQMLSTYAKGGKISKEQFGDLDDDLNEEYYQNRRSRR